MRKSSCRLGRHCPCGKVIVDKSVTGLCHPCFMAKMTRDPARRAKVSASLKRRLEDPANYARQCAQAKRAGLTKRMNPEWRKAAAKRMRDVQPLAMLSGQHLNRDWVKLSQMGLEARWAWCPPEYRETYKQLRGKGFLAPIAKQMLADQIKADTAKLSPFERQMRALERGGKIVANNDAKPASNQVVRRFG